MDYEKLHKETLEGLQRLVSEGRITVEIANRICSDFVAESEDERIRKMIVKIVEHHGDDTHISVEDEEAMFAWLEKQKENPKNANSISSNCVSDVKWANKVLTDAIVSLANSVDYNRDEPLIYAKEIDALKRLRQELIMQKEPKPAKTVYPEKLEDAIKLYYDTYGNGKLGFDNLSYLKFKDIVETFVRNYGQKPAEWSEEDEEMLKWLCRIVHSQRVEKVISLKEESELGRWMDKWLNHNPQPHWKPTAEQMVELAKGVEAKPDKHGKILNSLYNDLEKLCWSSAKKR